MAAFNPPVKPSAAWRGAFGETMRTLREAAGFKSQESLGRAVGYKDRNSINRIEAGNGIPDEHLIAYARALGIDPADLLRLLMRHFTPVRYAIQCPEYADHDTDFHRECRGDFRPS